MRQRAADLPTGLLKEVECSGVGTVAKAHLGTASPRPAASMSILRTLMSPCLRPILSGCVYIQVEQRVQSVLAQHSCHAQLMGRFALVQLCH